MRITIEIDETASPADGNGPAAGHVAEGEITPSVKLEGRASRVGARDGGAAPAQAPSGDGPPIPAVIYGQSAGLDAAISQSGEGVSAGPAPGLPDPPATRVEQDPDAPSAQQEDD